VCEMKKSYLQDIDPPPIACRREKAPARRPGPGAVRGGTPAGKRAEILIPGSRHVDLPVVARREFPKFAAQHQARAVEALCRLPQGLKFRHFLLSVIFCFSRCIFIHSQISQSRYQL
jgi:hypothetical protein